METKAEKALRYEAQVISPKHGVPLDQALEVARHQEVGNEKTRRKTDSRKASVRNLQRERRHDQAKRDTVPVVKIHGPPMQGGAPGLGKG